MFKSHFEKFNQDYSEKVVEADEKIAAFDELHSKHERLLHEHTESLKAKEYVEHQLKERSNLLGVVE